MLELLYLDPAWLRVVVFYGIKVKSESSGHEQESALRCTCSCMSALVLSVPPAPSVCSFTLFSSLIISVCCVCLCVCENSMNISWLSVVAEPVPERGFGPATTQRNANHTLALMANMIASVTLVTPFGCICCNNKLEN